MKQLTAPASVTLCSASAALAVLFIGLACGKPYAAPRVQETSPSADCCTLGRTLGLECAQADMVFVGVRRVSGADQRPRTTRLELSHILKPHALLRGRQVIDLAGSLQPTEGTGLYFIIMADAIKGQIAPSRVILCNSRAEAGRWGMYLTNVIRLRNSKVVDKLAFHFAHLGSSIDGISTDSCLVFWSADFRDITSAAAHYRPDVLAAMVCDKHIAGEKRGLFGLLLGVCKRDKDTRLFRQLLKPDEAKSLVPNKNFWRIDGRIGIEGILAGFCLLQPREGTEQLLRTLGDTSLPSGLRLAALGVMRFLLQNEYKKYLPLLFDKLLSSSKFWITGRLLIDQLRELQRWEALDRVVALSQRAGFSDRQTFVSIAQFALACPDRRAAKLVETLRRNHPEALRQARALLRQKP